MYMITECPGESIKYLLVFAQVLGTYINQIWTQPITNVQVQNLDLDTFFCCMFVIMPTLALG